MAASEPAANVRRRLAINFAAAYVLYLVVILIAGEPFNVASLVLGLGLAGVIVWLAELRRRRRLEGPRV